MALRWPSELGDALSLTHPLRPCPSMSDFRPSAYYLGNPGFYVLTALAPSSITGVSSAMPETRSPSVS